MKDSHKDLLLGVLVLFCLSILIVESGCSPYKTSWRILSAVKAAGVTTSRILGEGAKTKHDQCSKGREPRDPAYAKCMGRWPEAIKYWTQVVKPALNTALVVAVTSLQIAERAKTKPDILGLLKLGVCALLRIPEQFKALLGTRLIQVEAVTKPLAGVLQCQN